MQDFDDESFDGQEFIYSSFTYRIAALRNLGRVLASRKLATQDEATINRVDAYLVNWKLHLPESKKTIINSEGHLDEILFQAHMITEAYYPPPPSSTPLTLLQFHRAPPP